VTNNHDNDTDNDDKILFQADKGFIGSFYFIFISVLFYFGTFCSQIRFSPNKKVP